MADLNARPYSDNGLLTQLCVGGAIALFAISGHEHMKRKRRGTGPHPQPLGSVETWQFGYLFQGRSWAKHPSPPTPRGWILSWVKEVLKFPEAEVHKLRGLDAVFYIRFMRGAWWWALLQTATTMAILLPIHLIYSDQNGSVVIRADISGLASTKKGKSLLWIHICLLFWITGSWMATVYWICRGTFRYRAAAIDALATRDPASDAEKEKGPHEEPYYPHPHPNYPFQALPEAEEYVHDDWNRGLRLRTIMVTNIPTQLRTERDLRDYFQYYMSRPLAAPALGLTSSSTRPGFFNSSIAWAVNHVRKFPRRALFGRWRARAEDAAMAADKERADTAAAHPARPEDIPTIDRVTIARKMTELASLLQRREEVLVRLEAAHIKLARRALADVRAVLDARAAEPGTKNGRSPSQVLLRLVRRGTGAGAGKGPEITLDDASVDGSVEGEDRMDLLLRTLGPFVDEFGLHEHAVHHSLITKLRRAAGSTVDDADAAVAGDGRVHAPGEVHTRSVWDALLSLPRSTLDAYQPLIRLSALFRGKTVPAIDYHTAKLNLLNSLILEARAKPAEKYEPVSTAFVTFRDPRDAHRARKYLAVHPNNPMACVVTMAPSNEDLDWTRLMKSSYRAEFVKDWIVGIGVWVWTVLWLVPVSLMLGLVSINNLKKFWPALNSYLDRHHFANTILQSFLPVFLVSLLALAIPPLLLLIAKKAHTIITLSELHDRIMTRYYKFLILNVLVFFCVGTATLQSFLNSFKNLSGQNLINVITETFPSAGPFYVGWLLYTTAMHSGLELALLGLPLIVYPTTKRQLTPRKRNVGIRPRTFNYYYWMPNHLLVIHIALLFSLLNPLVIPFVLLYWTVDRTVVKNQLIHVYAKNYEGNAKVMMIRLLRYSFDGLILSQAVFLAYMVVADKVANIALSAILIAFTIAAKLVATRLCRAKFEEDDLREASAICGDVPRVDPTPPRAETPTAETHLLEEAHDAMPSIHPSFWTWRFPHKFNFAYATIPGRHHRAPPARRQPIPFGAANSPFARMRSLEVSAAPLHAQNSGGSASMPALRMVSSPIPEDDGDDEDDEFHDAPEMLEPPTILEVRSAPDIHERPETIYIQGLTNGHAIRPVQEPNEANDIHDDQDPEAAPVDRNGRGPRVTLDTQDVRDAQSTKSRVPLALVTPHPPHPSWDDESRLDHPYDNPYYVMGVSNALWVPRDPCGILNLDDTVDLFKSLTSEPGVGQLGAWGEVGLDADDLQLSMIESMMSDDADEVEIPWAESPGEMSPPAITGNEEIALPPVIASRVKSIDKENDVERTSTITRKRSTLNRQASFLSTKQDGEGNGKPSTPSLAPSVPRSASRRRSTRSTRSRLGRVDQEPAPPLPQSEHTTIARPPLAHTEPAGAASSGDAPQVLPQAPNPRRPSTYAGAPGFRSFSAGSDSRFSGYTRRTSSHYSEHERRVSITGGRRGSITFDPELGLGHPSGGALGSGGRPAFRSQASFTRSALSIVNSSSSRISARGPEPGLGAAQSLAPGAGPGAVGSLRARSGSVRAERMQPSLSGASGHAAYVSAHEAVVHEVIAEEAEAADERQRVEEEEEHRATRRLPWWKAWAFHSAEET